MAQKKVNVLIADDSPVSRDLLSFIIQSDAELNVIGTAENGQQAVEMAAQLNPDVIMMDIVMPKMNGFDATREIMAKQPTPIIIVSGVFNKDEITKAFDAIHAGAVTIIEKPKGIGDSQYLDTARFVIQTIKALSMVKVSQFNHQIQKTAISTAPSSPQINQPIDIIAIGASIGGPQALSQILSQLPGTFPVPILLVQHISSGFTPGFSQWLGATTKLRVKVAEHGEKARAATVYLSPDRYEMSINAEGVIQLDELPKNEKSNISINHLFQSISLSYGPRGIGVLLTGIGNDGIAGLQAIKARGGIAMVQDPNTTMLPDLPIAAIESGAATHIEPLSKIPSTLKLLAQKAAYKL